MIEYGFTKIKEESIELLEKKVTEELKKEGFGVLTRIDLKEKFKEKLGINFKNYIILGACNPPQAYESVLAEENIGLMLPCNIILYEKEKKTVISAIRPSAAMGMIQNEKLKETALEVEKKLKRVMDSI